MTYREFLTATANADITPEITEFANAAIAKLDAQNEMRKNTPSKKATENAPLVDQKASMLCRAAVTDGRANVTDIKVPKKGTQKGYTLA